MKHYSIWLSKYDRIRTGILEGLRSHSRDIEDALKKIPAENIVLPAPAGLKADGGMCFVDGGEGITELLGASLYIIRASALMLDGDGGKDNEAIIRDLDMNIMDYDDYTKERIELLRDCMEFDVAQQCVEKHKPNYLFLDGSLYVKARKKPIKCIEDTIYRKKFARLLKTCRDRNVNLVGVSEDSRSKILAGHLNAKYNISLPRFMTDIGILRLIAGNRKFRTATFIPQSKFETESQNEKMTASFPTAYLQVNESASPLRVDIADWNRPMEEALALITHLSEGSRYYGYPIPLYLAHMDAKINESHAKWAANQLSAHVQKNDQRLYESVLRKNRRSLRPQ
ncbi:MAG: DNA double-strand break repair nuclease NurA [Candidatus Altiarchaeota archaeon]|nr:DNA double-strand break repair nuclease NurA [Candidatus Altiarchaeota archaeon]